jgi:amino acid transporter
MAKQKYTGGMVLTDVTPGLKKKHFTLLGMTFFIYCACAGGAFGIEEMISSTGPGLTLLLLVLIPIFWGMPIGLYSSELTNLAPTEAGPYVWTKMAFGEFWGFSMGWWIAMANYLTGVAYVVLAADYFSLYFPMSAATSFCFKAAIIIAFTALNLKGLEEVSIASTIFSVIILVAFAAVFVVGIMHWDNSPVEPFMAADGLSSWGTGIAIGVWMYCGYICVSFMGGELENPQMLPKGMKLGIIVIALSYILPTLGGIVSTGPWYDWGTSIDYSSVLATHVGKWAGMGFMFIAVIGQCAIFNVAITSSSRSFMVLADDHLCPKFLSKLTKKSKVPYWPILILAALNLVLMNLNFEVLVTILSPLLFVLYVGLAFAFYRIRKDYPVDLRGDLYYVKGGKFSELFILIGPLVVGAISMIVNGTEYFLLGFLAIVIVVPMYPIFKKMYGGMVVRQPDEYPINPKTGLGVGDIRQMSNFFFIFGIVAFVGSFCLVLYSGSWGPAYYVETYGSGLLSNFWLMINIARWAGVAMLLLGAIFRFWAKKVEPSEDEE